MLQDTRENSRESEPVDDAAREHADDANAIDERSAYEAATEGDGSDPRCVPIRLDAPAPEGEAIDYPEYTADEHDTWRLLFARQRALLPGRACREYLEGLDRLSFPDDRIPRMTDVHRELHAATGWSMARVPGLLHEEDFFRYLSRRVFPSTDYIRPRSELDYTPAPDLFHDIFGHTPMIAHREFADFYQRMGQAALKAEGADRRRLERFYWFTVEFGLIDTPLGLRIYGNGILSSYAEVRHSLTDKVEKRPFDPDAIVEQTYDVWHMQPVLFVIESFEQLRDEFDRWARARGWID